MIADLSIYKDKEDLAQVVYNAYRRLFNDKFDPMIYGHEVELYIEPKEEVEDEMKIKKLESLHEEDEQAVEQPMDIYSVFVTMNEKNRRKAIRKARYKLYAKDNKDAWHTVWNGSDMGLPQGILSRANGDRITYVTKGEEPNTEWFLSKGRCPDEVFNKVDSEHKARQADWEKRKKEWDEEASKWKDLSMPSRSDEDALRDWINKQRYIENPAYPEKFLSNLEKQLDDGDRLRTIARLEDERRNKRG